MKKIEIGNRLTIEDVCQVASTPSIKVEISSSVLETINKNRKTVERVLNGSGSVYGINTGFGSLSDVRIEKDGLRELQVNLIRSHSSGVGRPIEERYARAIMLLRAHNLSLGYSGIRSDVVNSLLFFLNNNIIPVIPEKGSVGASGDLAPLAHLALALIGDGDVTYKGETRISSEVLRELKGKALELEAKEGLALINGTQFMTGLACVGLIEAENLFKHADLISALTIEGVQASFNAFQIRMSQIRPHKGQLAVSRNLLALSRDSEISTSHKNCQRVQDPYSIRCIPQVHGAIRDALGYLRNTVEVEINSVTDNPIVFEDSIISGGNFHGEPIALALDFGTIAVSELGSISERRLDKILTPAFSGGLPAYLAGNSGLNSGLMIAQYTSASLVNENKVLSYPSSVDSIPTSNNKEDHVSMGATGARKFLQVIDNVETILAIELMAAVEACEHRKPLKPAKALQPVIERVRAKIAKLEGDRVISGDIHEAKQLIRSRELLSGVEIE